MKRNISVMMAAVLVCALVLGAFGSASAAERVTQVKVLKGGVNVRSMPSNHSEIVATAKQDEVLDVDSQDNGWYHVYYNGKTGWVAQDRVQIHRIEDDGKPVAEYDKSRDNQAAGYHSMVSVDEIYDMGVPQIGSAVFREEQMNMVIFWVQTQLKATGIWYQGDLWHITGVLGKRTMQEISAFMEHVTQTGHSGCVDQKVINALVDYLGDRVVPVYVGGFYTAMDSIMFRDAYGTMDPIVSNLRDMVPHVTVGAKWVQTILKHLGVYRGKVDGMYGEETEKAVMLYQKARGFTDRDCVYLGVARRMLEDYYYSGGDLSLLP